MKQHGGIGCPVLASTRLVFHHVSISALVMVIIFLWGKTTFAQPSKDDITCLQAFQAQVNSSIDPHLLSNWTDAAFPCNVTGQEQRYAGISCSSSRVVTLNLSNYGLTGTISPNLSLCANLLTLDLSQNSLSGSIPQGLGMLPYLMSINLSHNRLTGDIPTQLANCTYLHELDLQYNQLTGTIPVALTTLSKLSIFDVSYNNLEGPIPTGLANTSTGAPRFNISSFEGNSGLYGYPIPEPKSHNLSILAIVGIGLGSGFLSLILSFTAVCIWLRVTEQRLAAEEGKISQLVPEYD